MLGDERVPHFASGAKYAVALWDGPPLTDRHYHAAGMEVEKIYDESGDQHFGRRSWQEQLQRRRP
ncbi:hypothetical protein [Novosphingobium pentaromativorans]|uniref:hypothetical protein n=1 Tax=Novosphingobium pentaromativorans TaxID=205844 RepID=UPI000B56D8B3|nr:hypothetical protein [Novosphingobium pentaromativorans]ART40736.1 L342 [uncultured bacterium]